MRLRVLKRVRPERIDVKTCDMLFEPQIEVERGISRGVGIGIDGSVEPTTWWHWGSHPGFQSLFVFEAEREDAIIVLTNTVGGLDVLTGNLGGYYLAEEIAREALGIPGTWDLHCDAPE